jgi:hypothetical protein
MSSLRGSDIVLTLESEDESPIKVKARVYFSDEQENPRIVCVECAANIMESFALRLKKEGESMERQTDELVENH